MSPAVQEYIKEINQKLEQYQFGKQPQELYEPIHYILSLGGKRLRPLLTLLAYRLYHDDEVTDQIMKPALAVEVFHNFTLMHDDIMDQAPLRRGKPAVHKKWNENIAILSGDVMIVKAYDLLTEVDSDKLLAVLRAFNQCATEVCEGQQWDMNFEGRESVSEEEYLGMIRQKTAVLLGLSLQLGAMLANASGQDCQLLYEFGVNIGISFQLKDDLLDVYADQAKFGKQLGGDIIANKKTFLLIKALEKADQSQREELTSWLEKEDFDKEEKIRAVKTLYNALNIQKITEQKMNEFFDLGIQQLEKIAVKPEKIKVLSQFAQELMAREK